MLQHVALEVRAGDVEAELAFWALLGWVEVDVPATLAHRSRWVGRDGAQVHYLFSDDPVVPPSAHAAVVAGHDAVEALRAAGHRVEARERHWDADRWYAWTPAGHVVEVMAAPPA